MSVDQDTLQRRYREFQDFMPAAIAIAGLPTSEGPMNFSVEQMEVRMRTLKGAFRLAQEMWREIAQGK